MIGIVVLQMGFNLAFVVALFFFWRARRGESFAKAETKLNSLTAKAIQWEKDIWQYNDLAQEQIRTLARIGEEASRILKKAESPCSPFAPTVEECELKAALSVESQASSLENFKSENSIPTITEIEKTRERIKSDMAIDLRTLLKDQLV